MVRFLQQKVVTRMWDREVETIKQFCLKYKNKNKKVKTFLNKLLVVEKSVKEKLLSNYMELSRCRHCVLFANLRLNQLKNERPESLRGKLFLEESGSHDEKLDNEVDYLLNLKKFRSQKAQKVIDALP